MELDFSQYDQEKTSHTFRGIEFNTTLYYGKDTDDLKIICLKYDGQTLYIPHGDDTIHEMVIDVQIETKEELEEMLSEAISVQDFELAQQIKNELDKLEG